MHPPRSATAACLAPLLLPIVLFSLPGCSGIHPQPITVSTPDAAPKSDLRIGRVLAKEGFEKLRQSRYEEASRIFNAGLKFAPDNAQLHFFNGLTYHLLYLRGDESKRELAITGYELALSYDPAHYHAALQLGRLEFEARRYEKSVDAFRHATDIDPQNGDAYIGLASAAYYAHDLNAARTAIDKAASLLPDQPEAVRASAMIYAALNEQAKAAAASSRYAVLETDPSSRARLNARMEQWRAWHASTPDSLLAQAPGGGFGITPSSPSGSSNADRAGAPAPGGASSRPWFECEGGGSYNSPSASSSSYGNSNGDETSALPSLPSPCQGAGNPRMVVLDINFIRTENNASSSYGINLLDGLSYVFSRGRSVNDVTTQQSGSPDSRTITITNARTRGLPANGIAYSLNIANSTDSRTEVLANPSLVALDRMPSTFFSGSNVTLGISGQYGSASMVADKPIGVSLSVTPTFVDNDTVLLSVKAARSFVETVNMAVIFGQTLQTSRNAVSANVVLKMGQTLVLSGLSEQEVQRNSDGVPVLKDIPVLQYLFGTKMTQNFTRSVLVLITPRIPTADRELMANTIKHIDTLSGGKSQYRPMIEQAMNAAPGGAPGNLEGTYRHAFGNKLYLQFRSGDLAVQHWSEPSRLEEFFRDLGELLYF